MIKNRISTKLLSTFLALVMLFGMLPVSVFADETKEELEETDRVEYYTGSEAGFGSRVLVT